MQYTKEILYTRILNDLSVILCYQ